MSLKVASNADAPRAVEAELVGELGARGVVQLECSICLEPIQSQDLQLTPCMHSYHKVCLATWLVIKNTCPVCVRPVAPSPQRTRIIYIRPDYYAALRLALPQALERYNHDIAARTRSPPRDNCWEEGGLFCAVLSGSLALTITGSVLVGLSSSTNSDPSNQAMRITGIVILIFGCLGSFFSGGVACIMCCVRR